MSLSFTSTYTADPPSATITNGQIQAKLYLPETTHGFYRGTRFDWSGVIYSLEVNGHDYYGPWFTRTDPHVHDFIYQNEDIVAGPCSAITGPVDEFKPLGWDEAKPGATFVKIGIGALRKPADEPYDNYHLYEIADPGEWRIQKKSNSVEFTQALGDSTSGFGYVYHKTVELIDGKPQMLLRQVIRNTGTRKIETTVYNHNFLVLDRRPLGPGITVTVPFQIQSPHPPDKNLAEIRGNQIVYLSPLKDRDTVATPLLGFSGSVEDNRIRIENASLGAGMTIRSDRPLIRESLWSIRSVLAVEPFIAITVDPGQEFTWTTRYEYFNLLRQ